MDQVRPNTLLAMLQKPDEPWLFDHLAEFEGEHHAVLQRAGEPTKHVYFPFLG